ncbi:MAG: cell wall hydrolase [Halanaerobiaceae bacterium]|jgi:N-acetylmuramoyl-L-alanine amidase|nr:cell wall hydrolase [Halanaerobiaceae bacterium]
MKKPTIKYTCIFTLLFFLIYSFMPVCPFVYRIFTADAAEIDKDDIYKGLGLALLLILISKVVESHDEKFIDYDDIFIEEPDIYVPDIDGYSKDDLNLLARLIYSESRGEPYEGQVAVGAVVLNRVRSKDFPNSIREVIYQKGQFTVVENGQINLIPDETAYRAAEDALRGKDPSLGALFFYNPKKAVTLDWLSTRETTVIIGNHVFAK